MINTLSLFSGAGGLDLGAQHAGATIRGCIEWDEDSVDTLKANLSDKSCVILNRDIGQTSSNELLEECKIKKSDVHLMIAGPPCQSFSKNNYWKRSGEEALRRRLRAQKKASKGSASYKGSTSLRKQVRNTSVESDPRTSMVMEYARLIKEIKPEGFIFENVASLLHKKNKKFLEEFITYTENIGYSTTEFLASSEQFGVPQIRKRVFVLGLLGKTKPKTPEITHSAEDSLFLSDIVPVKEYINKFRYKKYFEPEEVFDGRWAKYIPDIPPGMNYKALTAWAGYPNPVFEAETRFWNFLLKLSPDKPSWTIPANPGPWIGPFHWSNRRLRTTEMAAIQTFPDGYLFAGGRRSRVRQIGNAVPVLLAQKVLEPLINSINGS